MLPAYGRELLEIRNSGKRPTKPVYVVENWAVARALHDRDRIVLVADDWRRPYDFSPLRDLDVIGMPDDFYFVGHIVPRIRAARPRWARRTLVCDADRELSERVQLAMAMEAVASANARVAQTSQSCV